MSHEKFQKQINALFECATMCEHCSSSCLEEEDVKMMAGCIRLDRDCADICRLTATLLSRGSEHGIHLLKECIEVCESCAKECKKYTRMQHCKQCAEACDKCVDVCSEMIVNIN